MKRAAVVCLLILGLSGCFSGEQVLDRGIQLRRTLLSSNGCSFVSDLTADYGDHLYRFSAECQADASGKVSFCVTAPETIAGITGELSASGGQLTFDDHLLGFDMLAEDLVTPVSGPWIFVNTLRSGYICSAGMDEAYYRITINDSYEDDAMQLDIWLDEKNCPVRCEIVHEGRRILSMNIQNFQIL